MSEKETDKPAGLPRELRRRRLALAVILLALLGLSLAWQLTPLAQWLAPDRLVAQLRELGQTLGPWATVLVLALALSAVVPLGLLILVSQFALGPWIGSACIMAGALLSASFSQTLGRHLGQPLLLRLAGPRLILLSRQLERRGLLAVIALRLVPVAPFAIVNMVAGSTHLRRRDMLLGTAIGMLPGTLVMALFTEELLQAIRQPGPGRWALIAGIAALFSLGVWGLKRWLKAHA